MRPMRTVAVVIEPIANGARVHLNDYRYSGPSGQEGWSAASVDVK